MRADFCRCCGSARRNSKNFRVAKESKRRRNKALHRNQAADRDMAAPSSASGDLKTSTTPNKSARVID
jgi:hypothetical protein